MNGIEQKVKKLVKPKTRYIATVVLLLYEGCNMMKHVLL